MKIDIILEKKKFILKQNRAYKKAYFLYDKKVIARSYTSEIKKWLKPKAFWLFVIEKK